MRSVKTTAVALISGCLISGATALAWPAPPASDALSVAQSGSHNPVVQPGSSILAAPEFPRIQIRADAQNNCKPGQMYSAHDIVGDPQACIVGSIGSIGGVSPTVGGVPAL
jgi:hypothetical protein